MTRMTRRKEVSPMLATATLRMRSSRGALKLLGGGVVTALVAGIGRSEVVAAKIYGGH
jgi:hypothetical protein